MGSRLAREITQRVPVEYARVEIHRRESRARIGRLALEILVAAREATQRIREGAAAVRQHELQVGKAEEMAGIEKPRDRNGSIFQASDSVVEPVVVEPRLAAEGLRMQIDRHAKLRGGIPERIERGIVEVVAGRPFGQGAD